MANAISANKAELIAIANSVASEKIDGRRQYNGALLGTAGEDIIVDVPNLGETRLPLAQVHAAKLVLTDKLIQATAPLSSDGADTIEDIEEEGQD